MALLCHLNHDGDWCHHMENNAIVRSKTLFISEDKIEKELQKDLVDLGFERKTKIEPSVKEFLSWIEFKNKIMTLAVSSGLTLQINFSDKKYHRKFTPSTDLLCRACGWHLGYRKVWDLTAGLAVDSVLLAQAGFTVTAIERNPSLALLLREALRHFHKDNNDDPINLDASNSNFKNITFIWSESENFLNNNLNSEHLPDVVYYDPMYPSKNKTALPSKEMQILRELNGVNEESSSLLKKAIDLKVKRVVVKRPLKAHVILENPKFQLKSKLVRYDVY
jgi:16S rRNA (guanine1516-N2)-methyltransferase